MSTTVLYIYPRTKKHNGGTICRNNNLSALKDISNHVIEYGINVDCAKIIKIISFLTGYKGSATPYNTTVIKRLIKKNNIKIIFFDGSIYGKIAYLLHKDNSLRIITFFHNCETQLYSQSYYRYSDVIKSILLKNIKRSELLSMRSSTKSIFLTERDYNQCSLLYGVKLEKIISPIVIKNTYTFSGEIKHKKPQKLLFVGSYFFPNIHGLIWFINTILSEIDFTLTIVGKGFDSEEFIKQIRDTTKVDIKGFVDNLNEVYEQSDIVVQPVFEGSGMKTKTAECFMYGKPLVTTSEGLVGYDIDGLKNIYCCDTAESFIETLTNLRDKVIPSFCTDLRKCFDEKYSLEARTSNFRKIFSGIEK